MSQILSTRAEFLPKAQNIRGTGVLQGVEKRALKGPFLSTCVQPKALVNTTSHLVTAI